MKISLLIDKKMQTFVCHCRMYQQTKLPAQLSENEKKKSFITSGPEASQDNKTKRKQILGPGGSGADSEGVLGVQPNPSLTQNFTFMGNLGLIKSLWNTTLTLNILITLYLILLSNKSSLLL